MIRADNAALRMAMPQDPTGRVYMASPFTVYPTREMAWRDACRAAAALQACTSMAVYSPISDSYGLEAVGKATLTHAEWMLRDRTMLLACQLVAVAMLPGWETSKGIAQEIEWAGEAGIPVVYLQPVGQHDSGAYVIGSMDAGPPEGTAALTLFHPDLMREAWTAPMRDDPYAGEKTLDEVLEGLTEIHLPAGTPVVVTGPLVPMEPAIPNAPGTKGGGGVLMRRTAFLCLAFLASGLTACSDGGARVTDVGDCDLVVERMVCLPTIPTPQCHSEAILVVRKTPQCLKRPA